MKMMSLAIASAVLAAAAGTAGAGTVTVHFAPFQSGAGGEFRVQQLTGYSGEINKASDIDGMILTTGGTNGFGNNNASNGKVLAPAGNFWQDYSRADGSASQQNTRRTASNNRRSVADFQSFCLERSEQIQNGQTYAFSIDSGAIHGGHSGGNPDPIDHTTAWLYTQFRNNTLSNYNMWGDTLTEAQRESSARTLQTIMWFFEGELLNQVGGAPMTTLPLTAPTGTNSSRANPNGLTQIEWDQVLAWHAEATNAVAAGFRNTNVRALNLFVDNNGNGIYDSGDEPIQSILTLIPLPSGAGLAMAGLATLAIRRRIIR